MKRETIDLFNRIFKVLEPPPDLTYHNGRTDTAVCPLNRVAKAVSGIQKKHLGSGRLWMQ